jgi:transposase
MNPSRNAKTGLPTRAKPLIPAGCSPLRFLSLCRVPDNDNNPAERVIRMSKLRIKVSGCMRSMTGAEAFCAIRSYLATASRHGISWLGALTRAAGGRPWIPGTS